MSYRRPNAKHGGQYWSVSVLTWVTSMHYKATLWKGQTVRVGWLCSKKLPSILCYTAPKSAYYALQMSLLCSNFIPFCATLIPFRVGRTSGCFFLAPVCGSVLTLTFCFRGVRASYLINKDIGEAVAWELLPASHLTLPLRNLESPHAIKL